MSLSMPDLDTLTRGFLTVPEPRPIWEGTLVTARFDLSAYAPDLFERLHIAFPDRLSRAVDKRRAEYLAGRTLARVAQETLGHTPEQIPSAENRAPVWPTALAGSISHARGHVACLLLPRTAGAPGIDIEAIATDNALSAITKTALLNTDAALLQGSHLPWPTAATLLFSAKEALYKALFPTVQRFFGFDAARLARPPSDTTLTLELTQTLHPNLPAGTAFTVHYDATAVRVLTWMRAVP